MNATLEKKIEKIRFTLARPSADRVYHITPEQIKVVKAKSARRKYAREGKAQESAMHWCRTLWREPFDHPDPVHNKPSKQEIAEVKARLGVQG